jgi:hypothetical protein
MTEHYTRNTESVTKWCNRCGKRTQHQVSDGRVGRCMEHTVGGPDGLSVKQRQAKAKRERERQNPTLF